MSTLTPIVQTQCCIYCYFFLGGGYFSQALVYIQVQTPVRADPQVEQKTPKKGKRKDFVLWLKLKSQGPPNHTQ